MSNLHKETVTFRVARKWAGTGAWSTLVVALGLLAVAFSPERASAQQERGTFRLVTFSTGADLRLGATEGEGDADIVDIHNAIHFLIQERTGSLPRPTYVPAQMKELLAAGEEAMALVRQAFHAVLDLKAQGKFSEPGDPHRVFYPPSAVRLKPPIPNPPKILGLAGNYPREGYNPKFPSAFLKPATALVGHGDEIVLTEWVNKGVHEPELAVVMGKRAKNVSEAAAMDYVAGYTIMNDVTAQDLPQGGHTAAGSTLSKGLDTFAACGPFLTLKADLPDPHQLEIRVKINGQVQELPNNNTRLLLFKVPQLISYFSRIMTLEPGDIISTGVPAPVIQLRAGDVVEISIEKLGTLRNRVVR
ncbi:MAG: fumarylacetoacetate hydrolase family protein [Acidobacteria bacterium]|nr:fumarylacetoacetate hydrolase family protein [Acidobacteriota bacterium]